MNTRTVHRLCVLLRYRDGGSNLPPSLTDRSKVKNDLHLSHLMHYMIKPAGIPVVREKTPKQRQRECK